MANFTARYPGQGGGGGGGGVTSLNTETGDLTLTAGTGIAITTPTSTTIQIASTSAGDVTIGAFGSTPNANGLSISGSQVLNMQPGDATHPGGLSILAQSFAGDKTFVDRALIQNGTVTAPGLAFSGDLNNGLYYVGTDQWALTAGGNAGLEVRKSTGAFANIGMGGSASVSDSYPLLIQRDNTSVGTYLQISNPNTAASSKATFQLAADAGGNTGELSLFTAATGTAAYAGSLVLRPSDSTLRLSLIGGDLAGGYVTTYTGGDYTSTGETARFNADHTMQFMQSVATPTSPAAGLKFYEASGVFTTKTTGGAVSSFTGVNTGDQASGNLTDAGTDGIVITGGTGAVLGSGTSIAQHVADTTHNGYLSSTDWNTFNGKGAGTVTSVAQTVPAGQAIGGSPVTTTGTLAITGLPFSTYTAVTAAYTTVLTAGSATNLLKCDTSGSSNASYAVTLHTAVGCSGQVINFSLVAGTGVLSINTTSAQTIAFAGGALASGVIKLASIGDTLQVYSDGANWVVSQWGIAVQAQYTGTPTGTINGSFNTTTFPTKVTDTHSAYSGGTYTIPYSGSYVIIAQYETANGTVTVNQFFGISIQVGGSEKLTAYQYAQQVASDSLTCQVSDIIKLAVGNTLTIASISNMSTPTFNGATRAVFSISRVGD